MPCVNFEFLVRTHAIVANELSALTTKRDRLPPCTARTEPPPSPFCRRDLSFSRRRTRPAAPPRRLGVEMRLCDTRGRQRAAFPSVSPAPRYTPHSSSDCRAAAWPLKTAKRGNPAITLIRALHFELHPLMSLDRALGARIAL